MSVEPWLRWDEVGWLQHWESWGVGFPEKVTWELGFAEHLESSLCKKVGQCRKQRRFVEIQRHEGDASYVWVGIGADKAGKLSWKQILRFLRHPKDRDLFATDSLYSWLVFICTSSFSYEKIFCKQMHNKIKQQKKFFNVLFRMYFKTMGK